MRERLPATPTLACLALCGLILGAAAVDLLHTESRLPDVAHSSCDRDDSACRDAALSEQLARDRAADPLQDRYDSRAWLYACAILASVGIATAYALRTNARTEWPRIFTNLGVGGVWLGIAAIALLLATAGSSLAPPPGPVLVLPVGLVIAATAGTLVGRSEGWAERGQADGIRDVVLQIGKLALHIGTAGQMKRSRMDEVAAWLVSSALSLTAISCLLALVFVLAQPGCGASGSPPGWTDPIDAVAAVAAIAGMAAAVGALLLRRWVAALIGLVACPVALLSVLVSTCAFY